MKENELKTQNQEPKKGVKVLKSVLNAIINIMIVLVLITSILIAVMALTSKSSGISTIFGNTIQPIQSDSMKGGSPDGYKGRDFEKGDLMIAKATGFDNDKVYALGDIVTFKTQDAEGQEIFVAHRIVDVIKDEFGSTRYQTWGDNRAVSEVPDQLDKENYLFASDIASVYYCDGYEGSILKGVGSIVDFLKTQQGFFFVVLLPMIFFFMYELIRVVLNATNYKKAKANEEKDKAVAEAVAEALAANGVSSVNYADTAPAAPADMTPEQMEQFKQFMEFQKMQKAQQDAEQGASEQPGNED